MIETGYFLSFTTGLLGGFGHCIGMCGPVIGSYTLHAAGERGHGTGIFIHLLYNAGRITTYAFIGSLMGLTGSFVNVTGRIAGFQDIIVVIAGLMMIVMGLSIIGLLRVTGPLEKRNTLVIKAMRAVLENDSPWKYYPFGILLGSLPCGLSYSMFIGAAGTGNMLTGLFFVLAFGIGTVPALLLVGTAMTWLGSRMRGMIYRISGIMVTLTGIYYIVKGFGIDAYL
ncbi:MAG: sulfite exporter TauE/SafE family protein [bacterium]